MGSNMGWALRISGTEIIIEANILMDFRKGLVNIFGQMGAITREILSRALGVAMDSGL